MNKKILIVYHYIAHYRTPVFENLCRNDPQNNIDYYIAADIKSNIYSLKTIDINKNTIINKKLIPIKNIWITKNILWQRFLIPLILKERYDAVIFLGDMHFISTWIACTICRILNIKVYMWTHGILRSESGLKWRLRKLFYNLSDGLFLYGNRAKELLEQKGFPEKNLHVVYNSLDYEKQELEFKNIKNTPISNLKKLLNFNPDDKIIIYTGRITRDKRIDVAIKSLYSLISSDPSYKFLIVGEGEDLDRLKTIPRNLKMDKNIIFWGACYDESILAKLIYISDCMFIPGDIGLSGIHSLSYGTPVITHNNIQGHKPEFEAIEEGISGSFIDINNTNKLNETIIYWSQKKSLTPEMLIKNCRKKIDLYYNPANQKNIITNTILNDLTS